MYSVHTAIGNWCNVYLFFGEKKEKKGVTGFVRGFEICRSFRKVQANERVQSRRYLLRRTLGAVVVQCQEIKGGKVGRGGVGYV